MFDHFNQLIMFRMLKSSDSNSTDKMLLFINYLTVKWVLQKRKMQKTINVHKKKD